MNQLLLHILNSVFNRAGMNDRDHLHKKVSEVGPDVDWKWAVGGLLLLPTSIFLIWLFMR